MLKAGNFWSAGKILRGADGRLLKKILRLQLASFKRIGDFVSGGFKIIVDPPEALLKYGAED